jgi:hypothetical protein
MRIRHTAVFAFYPTATLKQITDITQLIQKMGDVYMREFGITDWVLEKHIPESFKPDRGHLLNEWTYPNLEALEKHKTSDAHRRIKEYKPRVYMCLAIDTPVSEQPAQKA